MAATIWCTTHQHAGEDDDRFAVSAGEARPRCAGMGRRALPVSFERNAEAASSTRATPTCRPAPRRGSASASPPHPAMRNSGMFIDFTTLGQDPDLLPQGFSSPEQLALLASLDVGASDRRRRHRSSHPRGELTVNAPR